MNIQNYKGTWPWKNFNPQTEIACKGTSCGCNGELWDSERYGLEMPDYFQISMDAIQALRDAWNRPIILNSAHRCLKHNESIENSSPHSQHLKIAFDCRCKKSDQDEFIALASKAGFTGIGRYNSFIHLDMGRKRQW